MTRSGSPATIAAGSTQHDVVELQALGQARGHQVEVLVELGLHARRAAARPRAARSRCRPRAARPRPPSTMASGTISPTEPSRAHRRRTSVGTRRARGTTASSPRERRTDVGGSRSGAIVRQQPGGVLDHLAGHPEPAGELLDVRVGLAEVAERLGPGPGRPGRGGLREVAEHGERAGRGAPGQRAQHHRREVLRLVGDDVRRATACARRGRRPRRPAPRRPATSASSRGSSAASPTAAAPARRRSRSPSARGGEEVGVRQQPPHQPGRVDGRPDRVGVVLDRLAAGHGVLHAVVGGVAGELHPHQDPVRQGLGHHRARGAVPHPARAQRGDELLDLVRRDPPPPRAARHDEPLGRRRHVRPERAAQHLGQPGVALERGHGGAVVAADRPLRVHRAQRPRRRAPRSWTASRRSRRARAARRGCSAGSWRSGRPPARPGGSAARGARRAGTPPGAGRRPSCRCPARPARRPSGTGRSGR